VVEVAVVISESFLNHLKYIRLEFRTIA